MICWRKASLRVELRLDANRRKDAPARNGGDALLKVAALGLLTLVSACDRNAAENVQQHAQGRESGLDAQSLSASGGRKERLARAKAEKVDARAAEPQPKDVSFAIPPTDLRLASRSAAVEEEDAAARGERRRAGHADREQSPVREPDEARRLRLGALSL